MLFNVLCILRFFAASSFLTPTSVWSMTCLATAPYYHSFSQCSCSLCCSLGFGFSSQVGSAVSTPHPSEQPVLVIFVLGGISYKEVGEVQQLLSAQNVQSNTRIILLSTRMLNAENVLHSFCL